MLKGLEVSVVRFSEIDLGDRIDADYFTKANLHIERELKNLHSHELREFGDFVASAFYPAATQLYSVGDTPFIRCVDCINYPFITKSQDDLFEKIPMSFVQENNGINLLGKNDIVITKVGSPCYASLVYEHDIVALSRTVMGLKNIQGINPFYLLVYLRSKYGFSQLLRARELTIQYQLTLERVRRILVYLPSSDFQQRIESLVKSAHTKLAESKSLYAQAEDTLLSELGLKDWQPKNKAVSIKSFSDFASSGRLDAEYYQSKYDELFEKLSKFPQIKIKDIINYPVSSGSTPKAGDSEYYSDEKTGIPFLRAVDIIQSRIDLNDLMYIKSRVHNGLLKRTQLHKGDVLFSIAGTVGRCGIFDYDFEANINQAIAILRFDESVVKHLYVVQFFNSKVGQLVIEKYARQGLQTNLNLEELSNLPIPILPQDTQKQIAELIQTSFALRQESKQLLESAKLAVEAEIER